MTQVIVFFGWLVIGIAVTLVIFGHAAIAFVYGIDRLLEDLWPSEGLSSLVWSAGSLIPGSIMLGIGKLMEKYDRHVAAREATEAAQGQSEEQSRPE